MFCEVPDIVYFPTALFLITLQQLFAFYGYYLSFACMWQMPFPGPQHCSGLSPHARPLPLANVSPSFHGCHVFAEADLHPKI